MTFQFANYFHDVSKYHIRLNGEADFRLVRQRQLATSYRYGFSFGVSYTFGSIYNNVVNPRFRDN